MPSFSQARGGIASTILYPLNNAIRPPSSESSKALCVLHSGTPHLHLGPAACVFTYPPSTAVKTRHIILLAVLAHHACLLPAVPAHYLPCWQGRRCCRLRRLCWQPPSFACSARLQLHGRPCFTFYSPKCPCRFVLFYAFSRAPSLWTDWGRQVDCFGTSLPGFLEFVNLVDQRTLSRQGALLAVMPPCRIATLLAGACFYIR